VADWAGMLRDGVLLAVTDGVAVTGPRPPDRDDRARAVSSALPRHGVVGRDSAAWVHSGRRTPARTCVLVPVGVRRPEPRADRWCAETTFDDDDVVVLDGVPVTSLERTAVDVARWYDPDTAVALLADLTTAGLDLTAVRRRLMALAGRPHVRRALGSVEAAARTRSSSGGPDPEPDVSAARRPGGLP